MTRYFLIALGASVLLISACGSNDDGTDNAIDHDVVTTDGTELDGVVGDNIAEDNGRPDDGQPDIVWVDLAQPDEGQPDVVVPEDLVPIDVPVEDVPVVDIVPVDVPVADVPVEDVVPEDLITTDVPAEDAAPEVAEDVFVPECYADADCIDYGESDECQTWTCDVETGMCVQNIMETGALCADGDFCTGPDYCENGACISGPAISCDDGNICTIDSCETFGCVNTADPSITTVLNCGTGVCYNEVEQCTDGVLNVCVPGEGTVESCDGVDEDCDGIVDNHIPAVGGACDSGLFNRCQAGTVACVDAELVCTPNIAPEAEKCDKIDNDCNGIVDDDTVTDGQACSVVGQLGACGVGETGCANGLINCVQVVFPEPEKCDGLDNDCDNNIDEDSPGAGVPCATGLLGVCGSGVTSCATGSLACVQTNFPSTEVCDGVDNDCDGVIDQANSTGCSLFYKDEDADGYGTSEFQCLCHATGLYNTTAPGDCCDIDARANPNGATYFATTDNCGSFDYNCDGTASIQYNYGDGSCGGLLYCKQDMVEGWIGAAPKCGETGTFLTDCTFVFGLPPTCEDTTKSLAQGCR